MQNTPPPAKPILNTIRNFQNVKKTRKNMAERFKTLYLYNHLGLAGH